jgi:hypothetical protein
VEAGSIIVHACDQTCELADQEEIDEVVEGGNYYLMVESNIRYFIIRWLGF